VRLTLILVAACSLTAQPAQTKGPRYNLDWGIRTKTLGKRLFGLPAVGGTLPGAILNQVNNRPRDWERTWEGGRNRLASQYGQFAISEVTEYFIAPAFNEDPRYERMGEAARLGQRLKRVLTGSLWVRKLEGEGHTFCYSRVVASYASWGVASRWHPAEHRDFAEFASRGSFRLVNRIGGNAFREFWPDIRRKLKR
jgi:hypothetical protein